MDIIASALQDVLVRGVGITATSFIIVFTSVLLWQQLQPEYEPPEKTDMISVFMFFAAYFTIIVCNAWRFIEDYDAHRPITIRTWLLVAAYLVTCLALARAGFLELYVRRKDHQDDDRRDRRRGD